MVTSKSDHDDNLESTATTNGNEKSAGCLCFIPLVYVGWASLAMQILIPSKNVKVEDFDALRMGREAAASRALPVGTRVLVVGGKVTAPVHAGSGTAQPGTQM